MPRLIKNRNCLSTKFERELTQKKLKKGYRFIVIVICLGCLVYNHVIAQGKQDTVAILPANFSDKDMQKLEKNLAASHKKLHKRQDEAMNKLKDQHQKILQKVQDADSVFALHLKQVWEDDTQMLNKALGPYIARIDTLAGLLEYLKKCKGQIPQVETIEDLITQVKEKLAIGNGLQNAAHRQQQLIEAWMGDNGISSIGFIDQFKKYKLELIGYKQQFEELKTVLNNPDKLERAILDGLHKIPAFNRFLEQNSQLAAIFGRRGNSGTGMSGTGIPIPGMQNRQNLFQQLQQRFGNTPQAAGNVPPILLESMENAMQNLGAAQKTIQEFEKLGDRGDIGNENLTPQEKEVASHKALATGQKLKFGYNIQSGGGINNFPAINDIGIRAGYLFSPRIEAGISIAYKLGLGESWQKIRLSHEGAAIRSFMDWRVASAGEKLLKGIWATAGYEANYWCGNEIQLAANSGNVSVPIGLPGRTHAGIAGLTKKIVKGKKELQFQILWQFAVDNNIRPASPFVFRWGKTF
jgi:hypothetical protein